MTLVGKNKLDHPSLGTAGGSTLHGQMESIFTTISDNLPARWKLFSSIANGTTEVYEHNLQVPMSDLRIHIYTTSSGVQTRLTDLTGWTIQATSGYEQSKLDITVPSSGGPFTFYVYVSHEPMSDKLSLTGGTLTGPLELPTAGYPTAGQHAATKDYVDSVAQGLDVKQSVKGATTANLAFLSGEQTIDGYTLVAGDRILVKDQLSKAANGIYVVSVSSWTRATDMDSWGEVPGAFCFVEKGIVNKDTGWVCIADQGGTIGTTAIEWSQFGGVGTYTADGEGLAVTGTLTGKTFSLVLNGSTLEKSNTGLRLNPTGAAVVGTLQSGAITTTAHQDFTAITTPANPDAGKLRAYAKADGKLYTLNSSGIEQAVGSGGSIVLVAKTAHGFVSADVGCPVYINASGDYVKARADAVNTAEVAGLINRVVDANNFEVCLGGEVTSIGANASGAMTVGELYFLSPTTAGALTATEPSVVGQVSKPIGIARTASALEFFNMRGVVVGGANARTQLNLAVQAAAQNIQDVSGYEAGELTGWVYIDQATDARFYVAAQFSKNGAGTNFNVSYQTSGDTPPAGFAITVTAAGMLQLTLATSVAGITAATINYALNAPALGVTLPLTISSNDVLFNDIKAQSSAGLTFKEDGGTAIGSVSDAGAWTFGPSGSSQTHSFKGRILQIDSDSASQTAYINCRRGTTDGAFYGIAGFNDAVVTGSLQGDNLVLSSTGRIVFGNTGSTLFGTVSSTGSWTFGPSAFGGVHRINCGTSGSATGGGFTVPANCVGYIDININGTVRRIPYYGT